MSSPLYASPFLSEAHLTSFSFTISIAGPPGASDWLLGSNVL